MVPLGLQTHPCGLCPVGTWPCPCARVCACLLFLQAPSPIGVKTTLLQNDSTFTKDSCKDPPCRSGRTPGAWGAQDCEEGHLHLSVPARVPYSRVCVCGLISTARSTEGPSAGIVLIMSGGGGGRQPAAADPWPGWGLEIVTLSKSLRKFLSSWRFEKHRRDPLFSRSSRKIKVMG